MGRHGAGKSVRNGPKIAIKVPRTPSGPTVSSMITEVLVKTPPPQIMTWKICLKQKDRSKIVLLSGSTIRSISSAVAVAPSACGHACMDGGESGRPRKGPNTEAGHCSRARQQKSGEVIESCRQRLQRNNPVRVVDF